MADGPYAALCAYTCAYGFCPPEICTCTRASTTKVDQPVTKNAQGASKVGEDYGLCDWACPRGECPSDLCVCTGSDCPTKERPKSFAAVTRAQVTRFFQGELGQNCVRRGYCANQDDPADSACPHGQVKIGWDRYGCKGNRAASVCCSANTLLSKATCKWRGGSGGPRPDCNGQCHEGETTVLRSSWGGEPSESGTKQCGRGVKALCCADPQYTVVAKSCRWTSW